MARDLNVALIGQAFMGKAHSNAWSQAPRFFDLPVNPVMHTVAARNAETLPGFAKRFGWANTSTNAKALAKNDEIDLVDISTPNDSHRMFSVQMLEAGKHVACEGKVHKVVRNGLICEKYHYVNAPLIKNQMYGNQHPQVI